VPFTTLRQIWYQSEQSFESFQILIGEVSLIICQGLHFIHDAAPAHFSLIALRYLNLKSPGRWIGRGGPVAWPPQSPGLNPLDFYLWGHFKSSPVDDVVTLRNEIVAGFQTICSMSGIWDCLWVAVRR
jgi:hypothetical protein